jgi:hypothetical protein
MFARITATATLTMMLVVGVALTYGTTATGGEATTNHVTTTILGPYSPTFVGTAATGCSAPGCNLLSGPFPTPSTANLTPDTAVPHAAAPNVLNDAATLPQRPRAMPYPALSRPGPDPAPSTINCPGPGCDHISSSSGGAHGVKGINAVDSGTLSTNLAVGDIEPADQGLCAGNGYAVEANNIGEIRIFDTALNRKSAVISLDTVMGLTGRGWSSGGDPSCLYDPDNGGHWFFTEIVSASTEASGGTFAGCFAAVANACYEGIAVSVGSSPFGPYNVYFLSADYNPKEPGYPTLLNDFAKIGTTRDAFLLFYDEFPFFGAGLGFGFSGDYEYAFNKNAFERGEPVMLQNGNPNPYFTVAIENMGLLPTPDGTCSTNGACWFEVIPAQSPDRSDFDNSHGGSGFMMGALDFFGAGDNRIAVFDWTGLSNLNSPNCNTCSGIQFGGQVFSNVLFYINNGITSTSISGAAPQKSGPIPLGAECVAALTPLGFSVNSVDGTSCPEGGVATNSDSFTQVSQTGGQLWTAASTLVTQSWASGPEMHYGAVYWVVGTNSFDRSGVFSLTSQGYVSPAHEEVEMPAMAAGGFSEDGNSQGSGGAIMTFTLSGNGGPTAADNGGFYPSTAYGRMSSSSNGLVGSQIYIADLGQSPADGFTEYVLFTPTQTRARWGDYSWAVFEPTTQRFYFATNYIQYPNCTGSDFTVTIPTCGGTRDGLANWGTSVNYVSLQNENQQ